MKLAQSDRNVTQLVECDAVGDSAHSANGFPIAVGYGIVLPIGVLQISEGVACAVSATQKAGVSVRALRYYEQQNLLHSTRNSGGQRQYPAGAVERVRLIQQLYSQGLPSRTILEVLPFAADSGEASPELLELLAAELDRLNQQMTDLRDVRNRLHDCITEARNHDGTGSPS
ncbi:MerR family transcriptional regulator [Streptomyces niveus]|uniref:MerR family transcriptional regulator n=1 Tax=Streptomyces niveus TaxID=193462 RepID=UPI00362F3F16